MSTWFSAYRKSLASAIVGLAVIAVTTVQAITTPGHVWSWFDTFTVVISIATPASVYWVENSGFGVDARAKAVVASVFAVFLAVLQTAQPFFTPGHKFTQADLYVIILGFLGALGVFGFKNTPTVGFTPGVVSDSPVVDSPLDGTPAPADPAALAA